MSLTDFVEQYDGIEAGTQLTNEEFSIAGTGTSL